VCVYVCFGNAEREREREISGGQRDRGDGGRWCGEGAGLFELELCENFVADKSHHRSTGVCGGGSWPALHGRWRSEGEDMAITFSYVTGCKTR